MTTTSPAVTDHLVPTWNDQVTLRIRTAGDGPPVVYLHGASGLVWDPFLDRMAEHHRIYAPEFPGTTPGDPHAIHAIDGVWDAVLIYEQALRSLGLHALPVIGQSFGGMLAAELAATFPDLVSRLVLLDPIGLWRDDAPVANWISASFPALAGMLFHDPTGGAAQSLLAMPDDPDLRASAQAAMVWNLGATGKLCWPIPDRRLRSRLHRVTAETLVVWGEQDTLIPAVYAEEFRSLIGDSRVELVPKSGHLPQVEQLDTTYGLVESFLR